jgi:hypothetical protein
VEIKNKIGRSKRSYQKPSEEENTNINNEMGFLPPRRITKLVVEIDGRKFRKVLNLDEETIKVQRLMGEKYEKYV